MPDDYKEVLLKASPLESHLDYLDVNKFDILVTKFHLDFVKVVESDPVVANVIYSKVRISYLTF